MEPVITINLKNIVDNYHAIKKYCQKNIIAVIKDNAYGHGLIKVAQALSKTNVFMLCVSSIQEAINIRKSLIFTPILLLGRCDDANLLYSFKITPSITSIDHLKALDKSKIPLPIHLEIETGMNRLGINDNDLDECLEILSKSKMRLRGIFTHLCSSNIDCQLNIFKKSLEKFDLSKLIVHCQASSYINQKFDFVNCLRIGLALYGYSPYIDLKPALKLEVPILRCNPIKKGVPVGYDYVESSPEDGYIITIPWGYSFGLSRIRKLCLRYNDDTIYQCGKSCMDLTMFFSSHYIKAGTMLNLFEIANLKNLLLENDESVYYALSSLNPNLVRFYISD